MKRKNIVILGGGTAGWLTAHWCRVTLPDHSVTLIQSDTVGIIGVGEATTPHIVSFLKNLNFDVKDIVKNTNGSIKNGISFENWNGDGKKYFHAFSESLTNFGIENVFGTDCYDFYLKHCINQDLSFNEYLYQGALAYDNKVDLDHTSWALHFDAKLLADYLENKGKERGINLIEGDLKKVYQRENGIIDKLELDKGIEVAVDFLFDCTGFHRLIIGKVFEEKWKSFKDHLPMKKAIPFWLEPDSEPKPYTRSICMKYGWMWNITLQHRVGSGYVFDSDYIDEELALKEAEEFYGCKIKINKVIPFEAGRYENWWVKNCIAVGLSSNFIEPLESTSLWLTVAQLDTFRQFINEIDTLDQKSIDQYNEICRNNMDEVLNFVYLHYITKRQDTDFWKNFKENYPVPPKLIDSLEAVKEGRARYFDFNKNKVTANFPLPSFLQVCQGLGIIEKKFNLDNLHRLTPSVDEYKKIIDKSVSDAIKLKDLLARLKDV